MGPDVMVIIDRALWMLFGALMGGLAGHYLAIGRDRRREFNEVADRVYVDLGRYHPFDIGPNAEDIVLLRRMMKLSTRRRFDDAHEEYKASRDIGNQRQDSSGQVHYIDVNRIKNAISNLQGFLHRK